MALGARAGRSSPHSLSHAQSSDGGGVNDGGDGGGGGGDDDEDDVEEEEGVSVFDELVACLEAGGGARVVDTPPEGACALVYVCPGAFTYAPLCAELVDPTSFTNRAIRAACLGELAYEVGARVLHPKHGKGTVTEMLEDARIVVMFDIGESHRYRPSSLHKLSPDLSADSAAADSAAADPPPGPAPDSAGAGAGTGASAAALAPMMVHVESGSSEQVTAPEPSPTEPSPRPTPARSPSARKWKQMSMARAASAAMAETSTRERAAARARALLPPSGPKPASTLVPLFSTAAGFGTYMETLPNQLKPLRDLGLFRLFFQKWPECTALRAAAAAQALTGLPRVLATSAAEDEAGERSRQSFRKRIISAGGEGAQRIISAGGEGAQRIISAGGEGAQRIISAGGEGALAAASFAAVAAQRAPSLPSPKVPSLPTCRKSSGGIGRKSSSREASPASPSSLESGHQATLPTSVPAVPAGSSSRGAAERATVRPSDAE